MLKEKEKIDKHQELTIHVDTGRNNKPEAQIMETISSKSTYHHLVEEDYSRRVAG